MISKVSSLSKRLLSIHYILLYKLSRFWKPSKCGCIPMLDKVINSSFYFDQSYTLGFLSYNGIFRFFINIISVFGFDLTIRLFESSAKIIQLFEYTVFITPTRTYNGFTTYISNFYIDFGIFGVIILSFLFGSVAYILYKRFVDTPCVENFIVLTLIYYFIAFSVVRFQLSNTISAIAFIYSLFFIHPKFKIKF